MGQATGVTRTVGMLMDIYRYTDASVALSMVCAKHAEVGGRSVVQCGIVGPQARDDDFLLSQGALLAWFESCQPAPLAVHSSR